MHRERLERASQLLLLHVSMRERAEVEGTEAKAESRKAQRRARRESEGRHAQTGRHTSECGGWAE